MSKKFPTDYTEKTSIVDNDEYAVADSAAGGALVPIKHSTVKSDIQDINSLSSKSSLVDADEFMINDSEDSNNPKKVIRSVVAEYVLNYINSLSTKSSLVNNDEFVINDSADSNNPKKVLRSVVAEYVLNYLHSLSSKPGPIAADEVLLNDSADSFNAKRATIGSIPVVSTILSVSTDGSILSGQNIVEIDASATRVSRALPDRASVEGQTFYIKNIANGIARLQRAGSDVIGSKSKTEINLYWADDDLELFAGTSKWEIKRCNSNIGGERNISDWTNSDIAGIIEVDIDGGSSPSLGFEIGELIQESTSGYEGRIYDITDNADGTGTLWLYDCDGNFTDGRTLTGQNSSSTADVNEGSGSTKNLDTNFKHNFDENISCCNLEYHFSISTDGTENNTLIPFGAVHEGGSNHLGHTLYQDDSNIFHHKTGSSGVGINSDSTGNRDVVDIEDYFLKSFVRLNY